jgi:hypothetical protein
MDLLKITNGQQHEKNINLFPIACIFLYIQVLQIRFI